jgi:hypothetical protein
MIGSSDKLFECSNELMGSIKGREFFDQLSDRQLLNKKSAPWSSLPFKEMTCGKPHTVY